MKDMDKEKEVKRFTPTFIKQENGKKCWQGMTDDVNGHWVEYFDWQAERTKREEAEKEIELLKKDNNGINFILHGDILKKEDNIKELESQLATANAKIVELEGLLNTAKHLRISPEQKNLDVLQAKIVELEAQNELLANPAYCPVCRSCGEVGCCGKERCLYPDAGLHDANYEIEDLKEKLSTANKKAEKLVEALEKYGSHIGNCLNTKKIGCICGFKQALKECRGDV